MNGKIHETKNETRLESDVWGTKPFFQVKINQQSEFLPGKPGEQIPNPNANKWAVRLVQGGTKWVSEKMFDDKNEAIEYAETLVP